MFTTQKSNICHLFYRSGHFNIGKSADFSFSISIWDDISILCGSKSESSIFRCAASAAHFFMKGDNYMCIMSLVSLGVSVFGTIIYATLLSSPSLAWLFVIIGIASVILPPIAKKLRITQEKKGKTIEIIAIVVGGFNFYCIFFALTTLPIFIGYLGWIICGITYKFVK